MLSIKPSSVPEYLKGSAFYLNLNAEDDEEVSVPKDCCKLDTSVTNKYDLEELLRTLRFWGVNKLPLTAISFMLSRPLISWECVAMNYERDLSSVADLFDIVNCSRDRQVCKATEQGNIDVLLYLLSQGYPVEFEYDDSTDEYFSRAANIAAGKGNLHILKMLQQFKCPFYADTVKAAALSGSLACLQFVISSGCQVSDNLVNCAFAGGNLECLKYVHEILKCSWTSFLFVELGYREGDPGICHNEQDLLQCLQYALQHGCPHDPKACDSCAVHNWPIMLQLLHQRGSPWDELTVRVAVLSGHLECLRYAVEHACPVSDDIFKFALLSGSVDIMQYLHGRGLPWPEDILSELHYNFGTEDKTAVSLACAYKLGCPRDPDTCYYASMCGWYDILVDAHQHGCEWDWCCTRAAAANGHLGCLIYLHENGCPWRQDSTSYALSSRKYDCLEYAIENGCASTNTTMEKYKELIAKGVY